MAKCGSKNPHHKPNASSPFQATFLNKDFCNLQLHKTGEGNTTLTQSCTHAPRMPPHTGTHEHAHTAHGAQGTPMLLLDLVKEGTHLASGNEKFKINILVTIVT